MGYVAGADQRGARLRYSAARAHQDLLGSTLALFDQLRKNLALKDDNSLQLKDIGVPWASRARSFVTNLLCFCLRCFY